MLECERLRLIEKCRLYMYNFFLKKMSWYGLYPAALNSLKTPEILEITKLFHVASCTRLQQFHKIDTSGTNLIAHMPFSS